MVTEVIDRASAIHGRPLALAISTPGIIDQSTRAGHLAGLQRRARGRLRSCRGHPRPPRDARAGGEQRQSRRGRREVVRARARRLNDGLHLRRCRNRHGHRDRRSSSSAEPTAPPGEIGYLPLVGDPFDPRHRLHGGLEDEIGAAGIVATFNERRAGDDPELSAAQEVFELAAHGNATRALGGRPRRRAGSARRSRRSARSSTPSWSCSAEGSARARCCSPRCAARPLRWFRSRRASRPACSATGPHCRGPSPWP